MHILQLTDFYRPVIGGLERHVETLSRELVRLGHTVTVVTLQTGDAPAEETLDGVHIVGFADGAAAERLFMRMPHSRFIRRSPIPARWPR